MLEAQNQIQLTAVKQNPQVSILISGFLFLMVVVESHSLAGQTEVQNI